MKKTKAQLKKEYKKLFNQWHKLNDELWKKRTAIKIKIETKQKAINKKMEKIRDEYDKLDKK